MHRTHSCLGITQDRWWGRCFTRSWNCIWRSALHFQVFCFHEFFFLFVKNFHSIMIISWFHKFFFFSFIPSYSLSYSILGLVNTQTSNNVCINNVDPTTLTNLCTSFAVYWPQPGWDFNGLTYLTCCSEEFVPADIGKYTYIRGA